MKDEMEKVYLDYYITLIGNDMLILNKYYSIGLHTKTLILADCSYDSYMF